MSSGERDSGKLCNEQEKLSVRNMQQYYMLDIYVLDYFE